MRPDPGKCSSPQQVLQEFETLRSAVIDACSVIYIRKSGFFEMLLEYLGLFSPAEVMREMGADAGSITPAECPAAEGSNDRRLVACALWLRLPLVSEDRRILTAARTAGIPAYNAVMMLNFLLWKRRLDAAQYARHRDRLEEFARYSHRIWEIAESVRAAVTPPSRG